MKTYPSDAMGDLDRALRIGLGAVLMMAASVGALDSWAWLGAALSATGVFRLCPVRAARAVWREQRHGG